eukprot:CAMPEP_0198735294 /NCGR_PEP_ID=MMETSP1475-20131203/58459_1 /TAXON_ID= ORGANISM="Unidentified sp., Strain CCMP1999" /NCGR_SAMPLE_ID=MMETSP1475 /ASSEMBLY_ACC=CAM_ASM_001111 /LENGTH=36 /DNA_ID= /DNA_START= /DNA_END= /DNA_ORIENTATION=
MTATLDSASPSRPSLLLLTITLVEAGDPAGPMAMFV